MRLIAALVITFGAMLQDLKFHRITNRWILFCLFFILWIGKGSGSGEISESFIGMLVSGGIVLPLWMIGGLGAGDVKLFVVMGGILGRPLIYEYIRITFLIGAVCSGVILCCSGAFSKRIRRFFQYLFTLVCSKKIEPYESLNYKKGVHLHFSIPMFLGVLWMMNKIV